MGTAVPTCVAVIGVGRSGTSATSGLLVKLGLTPPPPDDLVPAASSNEQGHWESKTLVRCDTRLLRKIGSSTYAPPEPMSSWKETTGYQDTKVIAERWFSSTYTGNPLALKDPRMCLTLPFWRDVLPAPMAAVLVLRDPIQNARSREARDGVPMTMGLAIWDRYQRSAVAGLEGLPTLVLEFDSMFANPSQTSAEVVKFLRQVGIKVLPEAEEAASTWLDSSLRHQKDRVDEYTDAAAVQREVFTQLSAQVGIHESWQAPTTLPPPPLWVDDIIRVRRLLDQHRRELKKVRSTRLYRVSSAVQKVKDRLPGK
jgi:hypothetical protein